VRLLHFYSDACRADRLVQRVEYGSWDELVHLRNNLVHGGLDLAHEWKRPLYTLLRHTDPLHHLTSAISRATGIPLRLTYLLQPNQFA
jgi:hypothetical protein